MVHIGDVGDLRLGAQAVHALALAIRLRFICRLELVALAILFHDFDMKGRGHSKLQIQCFDTTDLPIYHVNIRIVSCADVYGAILHGIQVCVTTSLLNNRKISTILIFVTKLRVGGILTPRSHSSILKCATACGGHLALDGQVSSHRAPHHLPGGARGTHSTLGTTLTLIPTITFQTSRARGALWAGRTTRGSGGTGGARWARWTRWATHCRFVLPRSQLLQKARMFRYLAANGVLSAQRVEALSFIVQRAHSSH